MFPLLLVQAVSAGPPPPTEDCIPELVTPESQSVVTAIPQEFQPAVSHLKRVYQGDIDSSLSFVRGDVENFISDDLGEHRTDMPAGRVSAKAMYEVATEGGKRPLSWFECKPNAESLRCALMFGSMGRGQFYVIEYWLEDELISRIRSWQVNSGGKSNG